MRKAERHLLLTTALCMLTACSAEGGHETEAISQPATQAAALSKGGAETVDDWGELAPENDIFERPPPRIGVRWSADINAMTSAPNDGGPAALNGIPIDHSGTQRAAQFGSSQVVKTLEGRRFALDGYVVPLESDDQGKVSELLFVPFYGACIHVPPPPPNQIVHVVLRTPIDVPELWNPFHLQGRLHLASFKADIANATYDAEEASITPVKG